jgi:flagellar hook protein FlgE
MSLMSSFDNGVAAMMAYTDAMNALSQNLANMRTPGYKRTEVSFSAMVSNVGGDRSNTGGVTSRVVRVVETPGTIEQTGQPLDLALSGPGMFVYSTRVDGTGDLFYSRKGSLSGYNVDGTDAPGSSYLSAFENLYLMAWDIDAEGNVAGTTPAEMKAIPYTLRQDFPGRATTSGTLSAIIPAAGAPTAANELYYYDADGAEQELLATWTNSGTNVWDLSFTGAGGAAIGTPTVVTFDGVGSIVSPTSVSVGGLFDLDISQVKQLGTYFVKGGYEQNGLGKSDFIEWDVSDSGVVSGKFPSGAVAPLYQLPVALFANVNQLESLSGDLWAASPNSGEAAFFNLGSVSRVLSGATELSNVELDDSFSQMIMTQRAYASAAQIIQTTDEMTRTVRDLR